MSWVLFVLFAGAAVGHFALLMRSHNWFYGVVIGRHAGSLIHIGHGFLILAGPLLFLIRFGFDVFAPFVLDPLWQAVLAGYLCVCWPVAFLYLPWITWQRCRRGEPAVVRSIRSRVVDIAKQLGAVPISANRSRLPARIPANEIFQVDFVERELALDRLPPAWDGLTILHLTDLHFQGVPDKSFFRRVMQIAAERPPDLVCLTGDIADSTFHHRWIIPTLGWLRWRIAAFAILGNHDYWYDPGAMRRRLTRLGLKYLGQAWQQIEVRGEPLIVIGTEYPWGPMPDLSGCPVGPFRLCLSHTPDNFAWARRAGVDLVLAGHVHGGQIRFPVIGSVLVPSRYGRAYDCGTFHEAPTVLHVGRGLGGENPLRWGCKPEVTLLTLRCGSRPP